MKKFGEVVVEAGLITPAQFNIVLAEKKKSKNRIKAREKEVRFSFFWIGRRRLRWWPF